MVGSRGCFGVFLIWNAALPRSSTRSICKESGTAIRGSAPSNARRASLARLARIARRVKRLEGRVSLLQAEVPVPPPGPLPVTCPEEARAVWPSDDLQAELTAAGAGASICVKPGTYRPAVPLRPLPRQVLTFEDGALLSGARVVTGWRKDGQYWVLDGQTQDFSDAPWLRNHRCNDNPGACIYEDLYRDDVPLEQSSTLEGLAADEVYFDSYGDHMYVAADPNGHEMEATVLTIGIDSTAPGVTIRGAVIEKMGWLGVKVNGRGWTLEDNEIRYAHATGLLLKGDDHVVRRNFFHHNGNSGIVATAGSRMLFEANELAFNNCLHFGNKPVPHHEGGAKFLGTSNVILRGNYSHDNDGDGWWFDTDNINIVVENNRFEANSRNGFFYEVSFDALIRNNVFKDNGTDRSWMGSGIRIASSKNVEIVGNVFEGNDYSTLFANWVDRGSGAYGIHETTNLNVHDNTFTMNAGWIGSSWGLERIAAASAHNRFARNTYVVPDPTKRWWIWGSSGFLTWTEWRSLGFDVDGEVSVG